MLAMAIVLHAALRKEVRVPREDAVVPADLSSYRDFVFRCALAVCGEPDGAEDVAQEVLLALYRARARLIRIENPHAWIRRVTVRFAIRHLKRRRNHEPIPENMPLPSTDVTTLDVYAALRDLTPEQRALLGMALNQGLSYREIADALGIPEGTVASRLNSAKKAFQKRWER